MEDSMNCLKVAMLSVGALPAIKDDFGVFGMKEGSKQVQLHMKWTVWIHKTMTMMSFNKYLPSV
jgi:hypothetical protein